MLTTDTLQRTDWFTEQDPTIPGQYEVKIGSGDGGHVFRRRFDGKTWFNSVTNEPSTLRIPWRGVVPGSITVDRYPNATREVLHIAPHPVPRDCTMGIHSWCSEPSHQSAETQCIFCGEPYGNPD